MYILSNIYSNMAYNPSLWLAVVPVILYDRPTPPQEGLSKPSPESYYTSQLLGLCGLLLVHVYRLYLVRIWIRDLCIVGISQVFQEALPGYDTAPFHPLTALSSGYKPSNSIQILNFEFETP